MCRCELDAARVVGLVGEWEGSGWGILGTATLPWDPACPIRDMTRAIQTVDLRCMIESSRYLHNHKNYR